MATVLRPTTAWYAPADVTGGAGHATVVSRGRTLVMLGDAPADAVRAVWDAVGASASVTAVVDALAGLPGAGLTTLPSFAAVTVDDDRRAHVLARGDVLVTLESSAGRAEVDGSDVMTWQERRVDDVASVVLGRGPGDLAVVVADPGALPLVEGVVRSGLVAVDLSGDARPGAASGGSRAGRPEPARPAPGEAARPEPADPEPADPAPADPGPADPGPAGPGPVESETVSPETLLPALAWSDEPPARTGEPGGVAPDAPQAGQLPVEATQAGPLDEADDAYAHLWGATVMRTVEDAAVRADDDEDESGDPAPAAAPQTPSPQGPVPPAPVAPGPAAVAPAQDGEAGLIAGIPRAWGGSALAQAAPQDGTAQAVVPQPAAEPQQVDLDAVDHDGHTVMSSALAHLRHAAAPDPEPEPVSAVVFGAQVLGRTCPQGHVNPPSRDDCRTCGAPLDGEAGPAPRPSLGRVRVAGGPVVDLDRPLVVGRRPRTPRSTAGEMPRLVAVASPNQDVSRSHVEVRLEGWHVLVTDLATTNGTVLHRDGQAPQRLHPSEATLVVDGDVIDLGDGVTLTFEEIW